MESQSNFSAVSSAVTQSGFSVASGSLVTETEDETEVSETEQSETGSEESDEDVLYVSRQAPTMKKIETPVIGNWKNAGVSMSTMSASTMNASENSFAPIDYEELARQRFEHKKVNLNLICLAFSNLIFWFFLGNGSRANGTRETARD